MTENKAAPVRIDRGSFCRSHYYEWQCLELQISRVGHFRSNDVAGFDLDFLADDEVAADQADGAEEGCSADCGSGGFGALLTGNWLAFLAWFKIQVSASGLHPVQCDLEAGVHPVAASFVNFADVAADLCALSQNHSVVDFDVICDREPDGLALADCL